MNIDPHARDPQYVVAKLGNVVAALVRRGDMHSRLRAALEELSDLHAGDFPTVWNRQGCEPPENLRASFEQIIDRVSREEPVGNEGSIPATLAAMREEEAEEVAQWMLELEWKMREYWCSLTL